MKRHKLFNISELTYIPIVVIALLYVGVYGGAIWLGVKILKHVARATQHTESFDSMPH